MGNLKNKEIQKEEEKSKEPIDTSRLKLSPNDISPEKDESTETLSTVNRINTERL